MLLQVVGTIAALYQPTLNAHIINNGVAKGDTSYIIRTGALTLVVDRSSAASPPCTSRAACRRASAGTCATARKRLPIRDGVRITHRAPSRQQTKAGTRPSGPPLFRCSPQPRTLRIATGSVPPLLRCSRALTQGRAAESR